MTATSRSRNWLITELHHASRLWKEGKTIEDIAAALNRSVYSTKWQTKRRRDLFPRRHTPKNELKEVTNLKVAVSPYTHALIKKEAKERGISVNMLIRETLMHRFVRKTWKLPANTSTEKVKYSNGSLAF